MPKKTKPPALLSDSTISGVTETYERRIRRRKISPRMIVDPEWKETDEGQEYARIQRLRVEDQCLANRDCFEDYYPEDYDKALPEEGDWIILLMSIHVGKATGADNDNNVEAIIVPHLSVWYALPGQASSANYAGRYPRQAIIQTPQGEVRVWPHEYNIVDDITAYLSATEEEGVFIKFMNETGGFDVDRVFYLMSRGLPRGEVQKMLLPELHDPYFCYFLMHPSYSEWFGEGFGMGRIMPINDQRRAEAKKRMPAEVEVVSKQEVETIRASEMQVVDLDELLPLDAKSLNEMSGIELAGELEALRVVRERNEDDES